jgi:ubiquinone biosynthesis monooxygenase Coq6
VWDGISNARITFSAADLGQDNTEANMARLAENLNLQRGFLRQLRSLPQVCLMDKTKVKSISQESSENGSWPLVHLENGSTLKARLLVYYFHYK